MDPDSVVSQVQRRIELQSPEDLTYLITNVRNAAATRLNEAFPQVDGHDGEDDLRNQIEALINEYIDKTFALASPNLSINGLPVTPGSFLGGRPAASDTAYEPFDARKRQRVADLTTQEEKLLEEVASLKRSVPARAAAEYAEKLREGLKKDEDMAGEERRRAESEGGMGSTGRSHRLEGVGPLERQENVEAEFRGAVEALAKLKTDMSAMLAKMERARVAGEYVVAEGR